MAVVVQAAVGVFGNGAALARAVRDGTLG